MIPLFFGTDQRPLFGLYAPSGVRPRRRAVLLCPPWGQEYVRAHRSMHQLARRLNAGGHPVFKFDYSGTGDSSGEMVDARLAHWRDDISEAIDELLDASGAAKVSVVGLRLGGALAADVALRRAADIDSLVLWDPVWNGPAWLGEISAMRGAAGGLATSRSNLAGGGLAVLGFAIADAQIRELQAVALQPVLARLRCRTLVITSRAAEANEPGPLPDRVERIHVAADAAWLEDRNLGAGAIPTALLQSIEQWLK